MRVRATTRRTRVTRTNASRLVNKRYSSLIPELHLLSPDPSPHPILLQEVEEPLLVRWETFERVPHRFRAEACCGFARRNISGRCVLAGTSCTPSTRSLLARGARSAWSRPSPQLPAI